MFRRARQTFVCATKFTFFLSFYWFLLLLFFALFENTVFRRCAAAYQAEALDCFNFEKSEMRTMHEEKNI